MKITYKSSVCILVCILTLSIFPAFSECSDCSSGKCRSSQFSTSCRYNCSCHNSLSGGTVSYPGNQAPDLQPPSVQGAVSSGTADNALAANVIHQVNEERSKYGLAPLKYDPALAQAAYIRAAEIADVFSHTRPDGTSWRTVSSAAKGENIARGYNTADKVMAAWLSSEGHRANILKSSYTTIGVCAFEYNGILHWVQLFGTD